MAKENGTLEKHLFGKVLSLFLILSLLLVFMANKPYNKKNSRFIKVNEVLEGDFGQIKINGYYHKHFEDVYEEFKTNFTERGEAGASVCITKKGRVVVDLWGGLADVESKKTWEKDTISIVWSSTKGLTNLALLMLIDRGLVELDAPVTDYWPEYGQNGKENTTVRMLLAHQSGIQHFTAPVAQNGYADWDYMVNLIEQESPTFVPGRSYGYQALTHGWLLGEIVKRVTGKSLGTFIQDEITGPLGAEFWLGLPEELDKKTATMIFPTLDPFKSNPDFFKEVFFNPTSTQAAVFFNDGGFMTNFDSPVYRRSEIGGANGYSNARGLAKVYAFLANGGEIGDIELVEEEIIDTMSAVHSASYDNTLLIPVRFSLGFMKSTDNRNDLNPENREALIMSESAFGNPGFGGSVGFADPEEGLSFGYTMNKMGPGTLLNSRGQSLVDAMYKSLDYETNEGGRWVK